MLVVKVLDFGVFDVYNILISFTFFFTSSVSFFLNVCILPVLFL
jgi:hypothetical protein